MRREIERQVTGPSEKLARLLETAHRIHAQQRHDKDKVYSVHEPEVACIAKGKAGKPYEFGNKVSVAVTSRGGWLVGAKSFVSFRQGCVTPCSSACYVQSAAEVG